ALGGQAEVGGDGKVDKGTVDYRRSIDPDRRCGTCSMYSDGTCTLVAGPIDPDAVCDEWDPRTTADNMAKADGKAGGSAPKDRTGHWPGWERDLAVADHWAPVISQALIGAVPADTLAATWLQRASGDKTAARRWLDKHVDIAA